MNFLSPVLAFSCNSIRIQDLFFTDLPPAENHEQIGPRAESIIYDLAHRARFSVLSKDPGPEDPALISPQRGGVYLRLRME
jgi:hypothetical protein